MENTVVNDETNLDINAENDEILSSNSNDVVVMSYDYYYQMLEKTDTILNNTNSLVLNDTLRLENQEKIIEKLDKFNLLASTIVFFLGITFIYNFIKNMLKGE